jgi:hypothetical protein
MKKKEAEKLVSFSGLSAAVGSCTMVLEEMKSQIRTLFSTDELKQQFDDEMKELCIRLYGMQDILRAEIQPFLEGDER